MVVVDSSVFSLFLRRNQELNSTHLALFHDLFEKDQIVLIGSVYQELLSGIRHKKQFARLTTVLSGFELLLATAEDHKGAARFYNICRSNGVQGSSVDFLICAMASRRNHQILTLDADFEQYALYLPIKLLYS